MSLTEFSFQSFVNKIFRLRLATLQINHFLNVQQMKITKAIKNISNIEKSNEKTDRFQ